MDTLKYVALDDTTHVIGAGEYTVCGLVIPQGETFTTDEPKKLCSACAKRSKDTDEFGVPRRPAAVAPEAPETPAAAESPTATKEAKAATPATEATPATKDNLSVTIPAVTLPVKEAAKSGDKA